MYKLTKREAATYESIKAGLRVYQIAAQEQVHRTTIQGAVDCLIEAGLVRRLGFDSSKSIAYEAVPADYVIVDKRDEHAGVKIEDLISVSLSADQLDYLQQNRTEKRTVLAKRLGITKLQLNFILMTVGCAGWNRNYVKALSSMWNRNYTAITRLVVRSFG